MESSSSLHWSTLKVDKLSWKDTNLEFINSPESHKAQAQAGLTDPSFTNLQTTTGLQIWRVEQFKLVAWPKLGEFFSGDSYVILKIIEVKNIKHYDIHFWIGINSTQDEYATAAYKSVELDNVLGGTPIIHREVEGYESSKFLSYFPVFKILQGGVSSGFKHIEGKTFQNRLMKICKIEKTVIVSEISMIRSNLQSGDVFILDIGEKMYQFNGSKANKDERFTAAQVLNKMKSERGKVTAEVLEEEDWESVEVVKSMKDGENEGQPKITKELEVLPKKFFIVKEENNNTTFKEIECEQKLTKSLLDLTDCFIIDINTHLYVWIGENSSETEKKLALSYATTYLKGTAYPVIPITIVKSGQEPEEFWQSF